MIDGENIVDAMEVIQSGDVNRFSHRVDVTLLARYATLNKVNYITHQLGGEGK